MTRKNDIGICMTLLKRLSRTLTALVVFLVIGATSSNGDEPLLYEGFHYSGVIFSNARLGQNTFLGGGFGWGTNRWQSSTVSAATYEELVFFDFFTPAGGIPPLLGGSANKAMDNGGANWRYTQDLSPYFVPGEEIWFSFLIAMRTNFNGRLNFGFAVGAHADGNSGIGITVTNQLMYARANTTLSAQSLEVPLFGGNYGQGGSNLSYYIVGRYQAGELPSTDALHIWVNGGPNLDTNSVPTMSVTNFTLSGVPNNFRFNDVHAIPISSKIAIWFDEIKLGTSLESIQIAEPPEPPIIDVAGISVTNGLVSLIAAGNTNGWPLTPYYATSLGTNTQWVAITNYSDNPVGTTNVLSFPVPVPAAPSTHFNVATDPL